MSEKRNLPIDVAITCPSGLWMNRPQPGNYPETSLWKNHSPNVYEVKLFRRTIGL